MAASCSTKRRPNSSVRRCANPSSSLSGRRLRTSSWIWCRSLHDKEDTFDALSLQTLQTSPSVVDVSRAFLTLWQEGAPWSEAEKYFDCVFALENPEAAAGPGPFTQ